ncbi:hypothetical protein FH972_024050 [Carpinus fangiana]|uniref:non-specific serine/threonine protein kinase n=1 Tax=Carpinus fangiana TaxID=176857 RepID=A0A5N6KXE3_9ROSI|nr:hypothetical protein FH972_024050 [Carpinus fangiana]
MRRYPIHLHAGVSSVAVCRTRDSSDVSSERGNHLAHDLPPTSDRLRGLSGSRRCPATKVMRPLRPFLLSPHIRLPSLISPHLRRGTTQSLPRFSHRLYSLSHPRRSSPNPMSSTSTLAEPEIEYEHIEGAETIASYKRGGLHAVEIGGQLNSRYRIVHKLGFGTYSTTWLARDTSHDRLVAVKIARADSVPREASILRSLTRTQPTPDDNMDRNESIGEMRLGMMMVPPLLDEFMVTGPNGTHPCYVTEPASSSLAWAKGGAVGGLFHLDVARSLAAQLTLAVAFVHAHGLVHGDEQLYHRYNPPEYEAVCRLDGKPLPPGVPAHAVSTIWLGKSSTDITLPEAHIYLTDFGEAYSPSQVDRYESHAPTVSRPPEARFEPTTTLSFSSDIWTLACSLWGIIAWRSPFDNFFGSQDDTTCEQVDALGPLPPVWWQKWEARGDFFTEDGTPSDGRVVTTLEGRFDRSVQQYRLEAGMNTASDEERDAILALLRSMLSYKPADRPTVEQVLKSDWMQKWALPEYHRSR